MDFFLDTATIGEIQQGLEWGMVDGVTTSPTLIAKQGKTYLDTVSEIANFDYETRVLVASIRHTMHVVEAARLGADVVTLPFGVLEKLYRHPLTDKGLDRFLADWKATGQSAF